MNDGHPWEVVWVDPAGIPHWPPSRAAYARIDIRRSALVKSGDRGGFMVIVPDLPASRVAGHHLLDLPELYGLRE